MIAQESALIHFEKVTKRFDDGTVAVDSVDLTIPKGEFCVVLGASGAGKSTLLRMLNGMVMPTSGKILFDGEPVTAKTLRKLQPRMAMIHQQFHLVGRSSVLDNVLMGTLPNISTLRAWLHLFPDSQQRRACSCLARSGWANGISTVGPCNSLADNSNGSP